MSRKEITARERAMMILQVQAGKLTVKQAAEALGIAPQTYHEWEKRGLEAMMQGLTDREPGRPSTAPDAQTRKLQKQVSDLQKEVLLLGRTAEIRAKVLLLERLKEPMTRSPGTAKKKGRAHGQNRSRRQRLEAGSPTGLGATQPLDRDPAQAAASVERPSEHESAPDETARTPETGPGAADSGAGNP